MILKRLKIIDEKGAIDALFLSFYCSLLALAVALQVPSVLFFHAFIVSLICVRDLLSPRSKSEMDEIKVMLAEVESDLSALKITQGVKTLR